MKRIASDRGAKRLLGKTIVKIELNPFHVNDPATSGPVRARQVSFNPCIHFDDGTELTFAVDETEIGEYGVALLYGRRS